jgi:hypothetical protein
MSQSTDYVPIKVERRVIVKGWKVDGLHDYGRHGPEDSSSVHHNADQRFYDSQRARIGADVASDWQPHVTEVVMEERFVTPWRVIQADKQGVPS